MTPETDGEAFIRVSHAAVHNGLVLVQPSVDVYLLLDPRTLKVEVTVRMLREVEDHLLIAFGGWSS